jgi:hypothetical protein
MTDVEPFVDPVEGAETRHEEDVRDAVAAAFGDELDLVEWRPVDACERAQHLASPRRQLLAVTLCEAYGRLVFEIMPPVVLDEIERAMEPLARYLASDRPHVQARPRRKLVAA